MRLSSRKTGCNFRMKEGGGVVDSFGASPPVVTILILEIASLVHRAEFLVPSLYLMTPTATWTRWTTALSGPDSSP